MAKKLPQPKKVNIMDTILRDAHQSQAATRMRIEEMLPICPVLDAIGYYALEVWGGATFDTCLRFLNEDPWERLQKLRKALPNTKLQMLLRGQNILGYKHYADDTVEKFVERSIANGIDIIRTFDALNDVRNLRTSIEAAKKYGGTCEAAISYTTSKVHTTEYFVKLAATLEKMGADIICIKDMANLLLPYDAYNLVLQLKKRVKIPIHLHTHNTAGTGDMTNLKAVEAGCDIIDTALSPLGNGTSQPATEPMVASLMNTGYDTGLDLGKLNEASEYFRNVAQRLQRDGFLNPKVLSVDVNALIYQVPGGMLSNLLSQLKQQGASDKYEEVLKEVPKVRADFGYPPLVTPSSQIVGTQAVLNVIAGERYKMVTKESKGMLRGEYGRLPMPPNPEVVKQVIGTDKIIKRRPADGIKPELEKYKAECAEYAEKEEDVLSYALFPAVATDFFKSRVAARYKVDKIIYDNVEKVHPV
jgi:oxaloacetate decarboxylase alpha subunit